MELHFFQSIDWGKVLATFPDRHSSWSGGSVRAVQQQPQAVTIGPSKQAHLVSVVGLLQWAESPVQTNTLFGLNFPASGVPAEDG